VFMYSGAKIGAANENYFAATIQICNLLRIGSRCMPRASAKLGFSSSKQLSGKAKQVGPNQNENDGRRNRIIQATTVSYFDCRKYPAPTSSPVQIKLSKVVKMRNGLSGIPAIPAGTDISVHTPGIMRPKKTARQP
jgi:hypothetical protein